MQRRILLCTFVCTLLLVLGVEAGAQGPTPVPATPSTAAFDRKGQKPGQYGGTLRMLMAHVRDVRLMVVYGYARLVRFNDKLERAKRTLAAQATQGTTHHDIEKS